MLFYYFILNIVVKLWVIYKLLELSIMIVWVLYIWNIWYVGGCIWFVVFFLVKWLIVIFWEIGYKCCIVYVIIDDFWGIFEYIVVGNWSCVGVSYILVSDILLYWIIK